MLCSLSIGPVSLSTSAQLVAPCVALKGTLSITASELYFEVDEEDPGFKKIDPKVSDQWTPWNKSSDKLQAAFNSPFLPSFGFKFPHVHKLFLLYPCEI